MIGDDDQPGVRLRYSDPLAPVIPVAVIVRGARRRRRVRASVLAAVAVLATAAAASLGTAALSHPLVAAQPADQLSKLHRPGDPLVIVDRSVPGWESFVYLAPDQEVSAGTIGTAGPDKGNLSAGCVLATETEASTGTWIIKPAFQASPAPSGPNGSVLGIGLVRADVTSVRVTFRGTIVSAPAIAIPIHGARGFYAYAVWLPLHGATTYSWADITSVIAVDSTGTTVIETH